MILVINKISNLCGRLTLTVALLALAACSGPQRLDEGGGAFRPSATGARAVQRDSDEDEAGRLVHSDLILGMLAQRQYYAALAHIEEQKNQLGATPELRWLEAEARRRLGQSQTAETLYRGLLRSDYAAQAYHGLGLLYASRDLRNAVQQLQQAVQRRPTDAEMRNDLGYALMMAGRYQEALPQLATAVELDPNGDKARNNLIVLLLLTRDEAGAKRVADQSGVSAKSLAALRKQAQSLALKVQKPAG